MPNSTATACKANSLSPAHSAYGAAHCAALLDVSVRFGFSELPQTFFPRRPAILEIRSMAAAPG